MDKEFCMVCKEETLHRYTTLQGAGPCRNEDVKICTQCRTISAQGSSKGKNILSGYATGKEIHQ